MRIAEIRGREILDSRGNPTVEADVILDSGIMGRASVPSGASTGSREACELRDGNAARYHKKGVLKAVANINNDINAGLRHMPVDDQSVVDARLRALDNTENKSHLGANAMLAVSLAAARAHAAVMEKPLYETLGDFSAMYMPVPMVNVLNGGQHASNNVDIQEFMLMPVGAADFPAALQMATEIFHVLAGILRARKLATAVGDEGGFAPDLSSDLEALDLLSEAVTKAGFSLGRDIMFALDIAASELYQNNSYQINGKQYNAAELTEYYASLLNQYPIASIEDGLDENDWEGWRYLTAELGDRVQLVGDDVFVTNSACLLRGIEEKCANAILIKLNQIGTLSEAQKTMQLARLHQYNCIVSHRSGETEDTFIADLAVASGCGQIKTGSMCRGERIAKYNQLLRIHERSKFPYRGEELLQRFTR